MVLPETSDIIRRAERIYAERLKSELERTNLNDYLVIEPESGDFFLGHTLDEVAAKARAAHPDRRGHLMRVGHRAAFHMGGAT